MRMPGLDLLRAFAVVWVMLFHSFLVGGLGEHWTWLSRYGWMGVDVFFVLSGYLIGNKVLGELTATGRLRFGNFYVQRALRILPAFWAVLAAYALFPMLREAPGMEPWWKFAVFVFNLDVDYAVHQAFSHAWSLCVEEHFYLAFPLLAWWLVRRRSSAAIASVFILLIVGGIALRSGIWLRNAAIDPNLSTRNWFVEDLYYPTWCRLDGLLAGVGLAMLKCFNAPLWSRLQRHANAIFLLGIASMVLAFWLHAGRTSLLAQSIGWPVLSAALACIVFAAADRHAWIGQRAMPGAAWLATLSYSLYLSHKIALHVAQPWVESHVRGITAFFAYSTAVVMIGALLHYTVERPGLRLRQRLLTAKTPSVSAQPA